MTGRKKGNWSSEELERLRLLYPRCSEDRIVSIMNRSPESVRRRARELFQRPVWRREWTADEDLQLRISYGVLDLRYLALVLARNQRDVQERIEFFRQNRWRGAWTRAETLLLKQLYGSRSDVDLEVCLSRSRVQIARLARQLCLSKDKRFVAAVPSASEARKPMPRWSSEDERRLTALYPHRDNLEIARHLGRSVASVANKASQLGLKKSPKVLREMGRKNVAVRYSD